MAKQKKALGVWSTRKSCFGMPDKIPGDEYVLHMDAETAHIVSNACELYARLICGQFNEVRYLTLKPLGEKDDNFCERIQRCEDALLEAKKAAFPEFKMPANQSYGVGLAHQEQEKLQQYVGLHKNLNYHYLY